MFIIWKRSTLKYLCRLIEIGERILATLDDVKAEITALQTEVADKAAAVTTELKTLSDQIAALQAQVAAGGTVSPADLDALVAQLKTAEGAVAAIPVAPAA